METETRKLQKVGGSTFTVSIPKRWAQSHGLEAGVSVTLYAHDDGTLVVRDTDHDERRLAETTVDCGTANPERVRETVLSGYAAGYESVTLVAADGFDPAVRRAARSAADALVGAEVVEADEGSRDADAELLTVRTLLDASEVSVQQSVRHLRYLALSMHREATAALLDGSTVAQLPDRDDEVDRLYALVTRHFARALSSYREPDGLSVNRRELYEYTHVARQLERVADHAVGLARLAEEAPPAETAVRDPLTDLAEAARTVVDDAASSAVDGASLAAARSALSRRADVVADVDATHEAFRSGSVDGAYIYGRVLDRLARTAECGGNVAAVGLERAIRAGEAPEEGGPDTEGDGGADAAREGGG